ncbi:MAG: DUF835 domain-containing protein [Methanomassiliicoccales archaeon]|nr:DUF835 domain-containing protein [Methanomassiliicoccales archaeon]
MDLISVGLLSPIVGMIGVVMGIYVYKQSPGFPISKAFLMSMWLFFIGSFLDFALLYAPDHDFALWIARAELFVVVLLFASILYLASFLPHERFSGWFRGKESMLIIIAVLSGIIAVMPVAEVVYTPSGWGVTGTAAFVIWTAVVMGYICVTIFMVHHTCRDVKWERTRKQSQLISLGVISPVAYAFAFRGMETVNPDMPFILSPGFLALAGIFAYGIMRYRLFLPTVAKETDIRGVKRKDRELAESNKFLMVKEKRPDRSYRLFLSLLASGKNGLVVTRSHPDMVREEYRIEKTPVIWLAKQPGPDRIEPANLSILHHIVTDFLHKGQSTAVIIDSLEYIMENNPPDEVMAMLFDLRDEISVSDSTLLLSIDPETMDEQHVALLEREFQAVTA